MKLDNNNELWISSKTAVNAGINQNTIYKAKREQYSTMRVITDWDNGNALLIHYKSLDEKYKQLIDQEFGGDPYGYFSTQPIKDMVKYDNQGEQFYLDYRYGENKSLPTDKIRPYTWAASWLNMLKGVDENKMMVKKNLNITMDKFYLNVSAFIVADQVPLPSSFKKLRAKLKEYKEFGYEALIHKNYGNKCGAKISDKQSEAQLVEFLCKNGTDDVFVQWAYNDWAKKNGYENISVETVRHYKKLHKAEIEKANKGEKHFKEQYLPQINGVRPSVPFELWEHDDNHLDYYYTELATFDSKRNDYVRHKAVVITDSFNDYPLGKAYDTGDVTIELVKAAYVDAMHYIKELTGHWILPHEIKSDRWGMPNSKTLKNPNYKGTELSKFYKNIAPFIQPGLGGKNRGYIENFFGSAHWKRCQKFQANNYTGNNITAKNRGVNDEELRLNTSVRPLVGNEAEQQIEKFFYHLRHFPNAKGITKHNEWIEAYNKLQTSDLRIINDAQYLLTFGIELTNKGDGYEFTNAGIKFQLNGVQYWYVLENYQIELIGARVSIYFDPRQLDKVIFTDHQNIREVGVPNHLHKRTIKSHTKESRQYLEAAKARNRDLVTQFAKRIDERKALVNSSYADAEAILLNESAPKALKQEAEKRYLEQTNKMAKKPLKATQKEDLDITDLM